MSFSGLKVAHVKLHLGLTKECLIVPRVVFEALLVPLERLLIPLLNVLHFAQDEVKRRFQVIHVLSISRLISLLGTRLVFENREASQTQLARQLVLFLDEVVLGKVTDAKRVSRVGLEGSLEILHRLLPHLKVVDIRGDLDDSNRG